MSTDQATLDPLITFLIEIQEREGLTTTAMAERLGVDKSTWSCARRGIANSVGERFRLKAVRAFPELFELYTAQVLGNPDSWVVKNLHDGAGT